MLPRGRFDTLQNEILSDLRYCSATENQGYWGYSTSVRCLGHRVVDPSCQEKVSKYKAAMAFCATCLRRLPADEVQARKDFWWKDMVEFQDLKRKKN